MSLSHARAAVAGLAIAALFAAPARADTVIPDDLVVQGSACAGPDCVNNESFGFDTVRLKGPVLRLGFADTSLSAGFPSNDWAIAANDADGAGAENYLGIQDVSAGTTPVRILAGAPTDTLRVEADGSVRLPGGALIQRVSAANTEHSAAVDGDAVVTALGTLPISRFEFTGDPANTPHIGPTGQAFNTAFGVGAGTDYVAAGDQAGVALAATKELAERVADLTGPQGPKGETGPKGDTGPKGADARPSDGLAAAQKRLKGLEGAHKRLQVRNAELRKLVRKLRRGRR